MQHSSNSATALKEDSVIKAVNSFYFLASKFIENNGEVEAILPDLASGIRAIFPESNSIASVLTYDNKEYASGKTAGLLIFFDYSIFFQMVRHYMFNCSAQNQISQIPLN